VFEILITKKPFPFSCPSNNLEDRRCNLGKELVDETGDEHAEEDKPDHDDESSKDEDGKEVSLAAESEGVDDGVVVPLEVQESVVVLEVIIVLDALDFTSVQVEDGDPDSAVAVGQTNRVSAGTKNWSAD